VDPWEAGVAWMARLDWDPLPVFQDYSAYTAELDRLNSQTLRSLDGPERILRENTALIDPQYPTPTIDERVPAWDPPEATIAMLCNYRQLETTPRWQVLGKVGNRCGTPRRVATIRTAFDRPVTIPAPGRGEIVYAEVHGADVGGWERVRTLLYRSRLRYVLVNGRSRHRLVPGTAANGLLMAADARVDYRAPFALSPGARTVQFAGSSGPLRIDVYRVAVQT